ncbi:restriction endonuclease subunit S [Listeria booriae]|uniref:restriction endonuclease subunit S n=1 Tax=Listeria booriae TaxID=1552123 RepID=UPI00162699DF|nr:restriction endonuclease subunit S [Listeria booriae]MBC2205523.1 restriction endonuclease subunit S [Listeria booriae]
MSDKKRNVPVLRFNGFSDAWEQRKFGELGKVTTGKAFSSIDFDEQGEYLVITNKDISTSSRSQNVVTDRINVSDKNIIEKYNLNGENILVTMDGVNLGKTAMYSNENALLAQRVGRIQSTQLEFVYQITSSNNFFMTMRTLSVGNAIKHISLSQISNYSTLVPNNEAEQQKIGELFKHLDNTIALHQRKLDTLQQMKKGFLQQMFLENGEKSPQVRFADFQEEWKQRKLEVLAVFSKGRGYTKSDLVEKGTPIILYGHLYTKYEIIINKVNTFVAMKDKSVISKGNEVIVPSSGETAKDISRASVIGTEGFILGGDLNIIKPKREINSIFLALTISNGIQQKEMIKLAQGKSIVHLHNSDLKQIKLFYPSLGEQQQIGDFFIQLDSIITLYQNKLDKLNTLKRTYLKNMFI